MTYARHVGDVVCSPRELGAGKGAQSKEVGEGELVRTDAGSAERWSVVLRSRMNLVGGMVVGVTMSLRLQKNDDHCWRRRGNASSKGILRGQIGDQPSRKWYVISLLCSMAWHDAVGAIVLISFVFSSQWISAYTEGQVTVDVGQALHS